MSELRRMEDHMSSILPYRFLFRFSLPVGTVPKLPKKGRRLLGLPAECALPDFAELDRAPGFGEVRATWNPEGLGVSVEVHGKRKPLQCDLQRPLESDAFHIWIDTRSTLDVHRATRFCHHFCVLPGGKGAAKEQSSARQLPIARAREESALAEPADIQTGVERFPDGYLLEAWFPTRVLQGFEPETNPRLGFYYALHDSELGEQYLGVGPEFPFAHDPSLWWTLELV